MAGGQGKRFWPRSRRLTPKQFLQIAGAKTMLQDTVARLEPLLDSKDIFVVCGRAHVGQVRAQLDGIGEDQVIVEPFSRNTALCVALGAYYLKTRFADEVVATLPADHVIQDVEEFHKVLSVGKELAQQGWLVTFGIQPSYPSTGYGYLKQGESLGEFGDCRAYRVDQFSEKPDRALAQEFLQEGSYFWNSGMFMWTLESILAEIRIHMPALGHVLEEMDRNREDSARFEDIFSELPSISIDDGVMAKSRKVAMLPCHIGWNDLGSWAALGEVCDSDDKGITANSEYLNIDSQDCIVYSSEGKLGALVGVNNLIVVETKDALLICDRGRVEDVKHVVEQLKKDGREEYL